MTWIGLLFLIILIALWLVYEKKPKPALFILIVAFSYLFKMKLLPGYAPFFFSPKFAIGLEAPLIGLFPLAFLVPLARVWKDWKLSLYGMLFGLLGIAILSILAILAKATHWQFKLPSFAAARIFSNLFLTAIPEEAFYRGFIQDTFCRYLKSFKFGRIFALLLTSILFTAAHIYWSPNALVLIFVFFASLLYGGVYLLFGKIESAILCHFFLNLVHMTFFSYHAM